MRKNDVDIVIMWVDGSDPAWIREKLGYQMNSAVSDELVADSAKCFRDMGTLKYWFRSIEKFAPWVRKIHFVTWGHLPEWLDTSCKKLHIVNHKDFMPEGSLPTYNSRALEVNLHRIPGLAENFVYFNDDNFLMRPSKKSDFFKRGLPRDCAILSPVVPQRFGTGAIQINDLEIVNDHFHGTQCIKKNWKKWYTPKYGKYLLRTLILKKNANIVGLYEPHGPNSMKKSTYEEVWSKEEAALMGTTMSRFKKKDNVNQWLMRDWQIASGAFSPRSPKFGKFYDLSYSLDAACWDILSQKHSLICLNDSSDIEDFEQVKKRLVDCFEKILPKKSQFEI
ncbi:MAG: Stealth CR1 domain-containing protein [Lachnospiraceae bacterium]|nr:Stealth CR1 domain-containing protein [Lachnospiraceae bacterium]